MQPIIHAIDQLERCVQRPHPRACQVAKYLGNTVEFARTTEDAELSLRLHNLAGRVANKSPDLLPLAIRCHRVAASLTPSESRTPLDGQLLRKLAEGDVNACLALLKRGAQLSAITPTTADQCGLYAWLSAYRPGERCAAEELTHYAEELGYGYKAANLMVLRTLTEMISTALTELDVRVPEFIALSHREVRGALERLMPGVIASEWSKFIDRGATLDDKGQEILAGIRNQIEAAVQSNGIQNERLGAWLLEQDAEFLIVRSTGKEDSDTLSNAGGNLSIPFVRPQPYPLAVAIGEVVASYFSPHSIAQRLELGDPSLRTDPPFMPVLVQVMIMEGEEDESTQPLRSGVIFSHEPGASHKRTLIQAAYGQGDGVVSARVPVDSFYVDDQMHVTQVIRNKRYKAVQREVCTGTWAMQDVPVPAELARTPTLTWEQARDLKRMAQAVSAYYGDEQAPKAMDIEYGVRSDTLYLYQTRPLFASIENGSTAAQATPSFLDLDVCLKLPADQRIELSTLLAGRQQVVRVTKPETCLIASDLMTALPLYLASNHAVEVIIIGQACAQSSHPCVMLRPAGVPVLVASDKAVQARIRSWHSALDGRQSLLICPQRGMVVHAAAESDAPILTGRISYPMERAVSVPPSKFAGSDPQALQRILDEQEARYWTILRRLPQPDADQQLPSINTLLDRIARASKPDAQCALHRLLQLLHSQLKMQMTSPSVDQKIELLDVFHYVLDVVEEQLLPALTDEMPQSMERLFPLRILEALIFQSATAEGLRNFSYRSVLAEAQTQKRWGEQPLARLGSLAFSPKRRQRWMELLSTVSIDPVASRKLDQLIVRLAGLQVLPVWLNVTLGAQSAFDGSGDVIDALFQQVLDDEKSIKVVESKSSILNGLEAEIPQWADPKHYKKSIKEFEARVPLLYSDHVALYRQAGKLGELVQLAYLQRLTRIVDETIKSVTGSAQYSPEEKVKAFAQLLGVYSGMFGDALGLHHDLGYSGGQTLRSGLEHGLRFTSGGCYQSTAEFGCIGLAQLKQDIDNLDAEEQLVARTFFDVRPLVVKSGVDLHYGVYWPRTLEEHFTTYHQNLEMIHSYLMSHLGLTAATLAEFPASVAHAIGGSVVSVVLGEDRQVEATIISKLRQHSCEMRVRYDPREADSPVELRVRAFGVNEHSRWEHLAMFGVLLAFSDSENLSLLTPPKFTRDMNNRAQVVEFAIRIAPGYAKSLDGFRQAFSWALENMTMNHSITQETICEELATHLGFSKANLPQEAYAFLPTFDRGEAPTKRHRRDKR